MDKNGDNLHNHTVSVGKRLLWKSPYITGTQTITYNSKYKSGSLIPSFSISHRLEFQNQFFGLTFLLFAPKTLQPWT
jgi:hypothetical protein